MNSYILPHLKRNIYLIWVLHLLTFVGKPLLIIAGRPYSLKVFCLIGGLDLLTCCGNPLLVYGWSALLLKSFLFDLDAKIAYCLW